MGKLILIKNKDIIITEKEFEIVKFVASGCSNNKIAFEMNVSPRTAASHLQTLFTKCNVNTRVELVMFFVKNGKLTANDLN